MKPTLQELKKHLQASVTVNQAERIAALRGVTTWYAELQAFTTLDRAQLKWCERGEKARMLGMGGTTLPEQEAGLLTAIRFFEKAYGTTRIALIAEYNDRLEKQRSKLEEKAAKLEKQHEPALVLLREAFASFKLKFLISDAADAVPRGFNEQGDVVFSKARAKELLDLARGGSGIKILMEEFPTVVKAQSLVKDALGNSSLDSGKILTGLDQVGAALHDYLLVAKPVVEAGAAAVQVKDIPAKRITRKRTRPKTFYRVGSIMDQILRKLKASPFTNMTELFDSIEAADPDRFIRIMVKDGEDNGLWTIRKERGGVVVFKEVKS